MAEKRMFTGKITESDAFLDMPLTSQCLYFHLCMYADDEGFVKNPKRIQRMIGASDGDLKVLILKNFVLVYESGVIVIKHWKMHNAIRRDRLHETEYIEEKSMLYIKPNGAYTLDPAQGISFMSDRCLSDVSQMSVKCPSDVSVDEISIEENSIEKNNICHQIIEYLNQVLGTRYTTKNKTNISNINARISEGHTFEDFKAVIDKKYAQWHNDPKMASYLRPETLFCSKHFESYLNEIVEVKETKSVPSSDIPKSTFDKIHNFEERQIDYAELERLALGGK